MFLLAGVPAPPSGPGGGPLAAGRPPRHRRPRQLLQRQVQGVPRRRHQVRAPEAGMEKKTFNGTIFGLWGAPIYDVRSEWDDGREGGSKYLKNIINGSSLV